MSDPVALKACCADLYESRWVRLLLGDALHPGGTAITGRLGRVLGLGPWDWVLDMACDRGASAIHPARTFGCEVLGVDYGTANTAAPARAARAEGSAAARAFVAADAERLPCAGGAFDAVTCECAFCTFPDTRAAAAGLATPGEPKPHRADRSARAWSWSSVAVTAKPAVVRCRAYSAAGRASATQAIQQRAPADQIVRAHHPARPQDPADLSSVRELARVAERAIADGTLGYVLFLGCRCARS